MLFVLLTFFTALLALVIDPDTLREDHAWIVYSIATLGISLLFFEMKRWLGRRFAPNEVFLHPILYVAGWWLFMICLPGLFGFGDPELLKELAAGTPISYAFAAYGMLLALVGLLALWASYKFGLRIARPISFLQRLSLSQIEQAPVLCLYLTTVIVRLLRISIVGFNFGVDRSQLGALQAFDQWFGYIDDSRWLVLAIWALKVFRGDWKPSGLIALVSLELCYAFTTGFMKPLLWILLTTALVGAYAGVNFKKGTPYFIVGLCMAILIVPITEGIRKDYGLAGGFDARSTSAILESTIRGFRSSWGSGFGVGWEIFEQKMLGREAMVAHMPGVIMSKTPSSFEYEGFGQLLIDIPASFIPRALWPGKPQLSRGVWFSHNYLGIPESIETSSAPTIFGESYWYSGWYSTIFAMLIAGVFLAYLFRNTVSVGLVPLYVSLLPNLEVEGQFTVMVLTLTQRFLIGLFTIWALVVVSRQLGARTSRRGRGTGYERATRDNFAATTSPSATHSLL